MRNVCMLLLVAACGAKAPAPQPSPPANQRSATDPTPTTDEPTGAVCGTRGVAACPEKMFCNYQPGADCGETDKPGHCAARGEMCSDEIFKPVCGCDGKTYSDSCSAATSAVGVRADGACK